MTSELGGALTLRVETERWPLAAPFRIAGHTFEAVEVLVVSLEKNGHVGRGEAAGVYYRNDNPSTMSEQIKLLRTRIEAGISRDLLQHALGPGGARNALDCALWDLQAKLSGRPAWQLAGLEKPRPLRTTFTCGADTPETMASTALAYTNARAIKLKLTGEPVDAERIRAVREVLPDVWLGVDANQGFTRAFLEHIMPALIELHVALIEQPFPVGREAELDGLESPIPIGADESVQGISDLSRLVGRFDVLNIKLDKCGGLTEGLAMVRAARTLGFEIMVGCMPGTSLAMAPAFLLGQLCEVVDLDAPLFLKADRPVTARYADGFVMFPETLE